MSDGSSSSASNATSATTTSDSVSALSSQVTTSEATMIRSSGIEIPIIVVNGEIPSNATLIALSLTSNSDVSLLFEGQSLNVSDGANLGGTLRVRFDGAAEIGTVTLFEFVGTVSGDFSQIVVESDEECVYE